MSPPTYINDRNLCFYLCNLVKYKLAVLHPPHVNSWYYYWLFKIVGRPVSHPRAVLHPPHVNSWYYYWLFKIVGRPVSHLLYISLMYINMLLAVLTLLMLIHDTSLTIQDSRTTSASHPTHINNDRNICFYLCNLVKYKLAVLHPPSCWFMILLLTIWNSRAISVHIPLILIIILYL